MLELPPCPSSSVLPHLPSLPPPNHPLQMEGMITDIALAREKQQLFEDWMKVEEKKLKIDLSVQVQDN